MLIEQLRTKEANTKPKERDSFWCSESEKLNFDLYHEWIGTPYTNPVSVEKELMFEVGKQIEIAYVKRLQEVGVLQTLEDDAQLRIEMEREGIRVTGYADGITTDGIPVEVKSYYGYFQEKEIKSGKARESYLKQLAMYMDYLNAYKGILAYFDRGTGEITEFLLERSEKYPTVYKCNDVKFDLGATYKKWAKMYNDHILPKVEPQCEERYKIPISQIDWSKQTKSNIKKARVGHKVIGDGWKVAYSPYKDLIIQREGSTLGYSEDELKRIKSLTK